MDKEKLLKAIREGKVRDDQTLAIFKMVEEMKSEIEETLRIVESKNIDIKELVSNVKGKDGVDGKDYVITEDDINYIITEVKKIIPIPKDGKDGKDAVVDYKKIIREVLSNIRQPKDGINGKDAIVDYEKIITETAQGVLETIVIPEETGESIIDKVNKDKKKIIKKEKVEGLEEIERLATFGATRPMGVGGGSSGIREIKAGSGISVSNINEIVTISAPGSTTDEKVAYKSGSTPGYLKDVTVAGTGISLSEGTGADENKLKITNSGVITESDPLAVLATGSRAGATSQSQVFTNGITLNATTLKTDTVTGLKIGSSNLEKFGFFGVIPRAQQASTNDLGVSLSNLGLISVGDNYKLLTSGDINFSGIKNFNTGTFSLSGIFTDSSTATHSGSNTFTNVAIIDRTSIEAFLVRKASDGGDVFTVDSANSKIIVGGATHQIGFTGEEDHIILTAGVTESKYATLFSDKIYFTQTDGNEFIDSLNDGYMDYGATTAHRFNNDVNVSGIVTQEGIFAEIYVADGSTAQTVGTGTTYTKLTAFTTDGEEVNCTADSVNDKITITKAGKYRVEGSFSFYGDTSGATWRGALFYDGTEVSKIHWTRKIGASGDIGNAGFTGILTSVANKDIDVRVRHDGVGDETITIEYANLNISYLGE